MAYRNGLRLLKLVNSLLDFARIEAGRVQASYEPTDLAAFTADLASSFRSATDKAGLRLIVRLSAAAAAGLRGSGHVGEGGAEPDLECLQVYFGRRDRGAIGAGARRLHRPS